MKAFLVAVVLLATACIEVHNSRGLGLLDHAVEEDSLADAEQLVDVPAVPECGVEPQMGLAVRVEAGH